MVKLLMSIALVFLHLMIPVAIQASEPSEEITQMIATLGLREHSVPVRELPGWKVPEKVVVWMQTEEQLEGLRAVAPGVEIVGVTSPAQATEHIGDAQVLLGICQEPLLAKAEQLHWVQVYWAGVEDCTILPGMRKGRIILSNGQRIGSPALADHAIAMMMMLMRGLDIFHANQNADLWQRNSGANLLELGGRTVLVVGLGGIGTQVAWRAHNLGMRVLATRNSSRNGPDYVDYVGLADEAISLAKQADVVINATPLTDSTRGMFNRAFFDAMKESAYFISVGRGASTVTDDLVAALEKGQITGAGLDVTEPEPLPAGHPLWSTSRVIISPHVASRSDRSFQRLWLLVQENLRRYVEGDALLSVVNIERGY
ncbi:MAG: D-2-hydroxyacid dehydrogenase [Halieaceae bacterium]|jgi:phosphoglycerate dehydrogenase-like enzyme|nr:D-2-hydroxyacid dehydrogenase [Halieaceae bacterium]